MPLKQVRSTTRCVNSYKWGQNCNITLIYFSALSQAVIYLNHRHLVRFVIIWHHMVPMGTIQCHSVPFFMIRYYYGTIWYHSVHPVPFGTSRFIRYHLVQFSTIGCHPVPFGTIWYHPVLSGTIQYHLIPSCTVQYHMVPFGTNHYHLLPFGTILVGRVPLGTFGTIGYQFRWQGKVWERFGE